MEQNWSFIYLFEVGLISILVFVKTGQQVNPISGVWQEILLESPVVLQRKVSKALSSGSTEGKGIMFLPAETASATRRHGESCSARGLCIQEVCQKCCLLLGLVWNSLCTGTGFIARWLKFFPVQMDKTLENKPWWLWSPFWLPRPPQAAPQCRFGARGESFSRDTRAVVTRPWQPFRCLSPGSAPCRGAEELINQL